MNKVTIKKVENVVKISSSGPQGPAGTGGPGGGGDGAAWLSGQGAPSGGLGSVGDWYLNTSNDDVYEKTGTTTWTLRANIKGSTGATGATGATGSQGPQGIQGPQGNTGATGATGSAGSNGTNGATWRQGSSVPSNGTGVDGDFYLRTTTGDVYQRSAGTYSIIANITGPQGPTGATGSAGATGSTGAAGTNGATWRSGSSVPSNGTGVDGDFYLRTTTGDVYLRASVTYSIVANITGPTGATGSAGATGPAGPSGIVSCKTVATSNVASLSGTTTVDSVSLVAGDLVLLTAQSTGSQNGPWVIAAGAWTRPTWYPSAGTTQSFYGLLIDILLGTSNSGSGWFVSTTGAITIDTTATAWTKVTLAGVGGGSGTKSIALFLPVHNEPPSSNYATLVYRNNHPSLAFDTTTQETAIFRGVVPQGATMTNGFTIYIQWAATSATSGTIGWDVTFERVASGGIDIDSDSWGTAATVTATTVSGTSGITTTTSVAITQANLPASLAAGDMYRCRIRRDVANDTATGDAELYRVEIQLT